ncbi:tyrosine-type recombinase/integrase (plasmid) [Nostoc edaphicum CCNP1411]|uniref:Tyrosine-type recombinase/integrase n=1 Tax=Nostoc edaphicum CCNP1411 TaxID=1472755 RepID=A0A7D7QH51_9NOSO|nr:tyrosine-type recombinase/integrase [Nostoc edaphicum]QMS86081.1 tyrosine-type recombinase/integrase [Nostoc edaphicum CCNP1411]
MSKDTESVELVVVQKLENALSANIEAYFAGVIDSDPDVLEELLKSKNSEGTRKAYRKDITDFFTRMTGLRPNRDSILEFLHLEGHKATLVVTKYRAILAEAGLAPNTINRRLAAIKSLVAFGRKLGVCNYAVDVDSIPVQSYRDTSGVTEQEFLSVIRQCDRSTLAGKRDYALLLLLWGNALRRNEISTLDLRHFDGSKGTLSILGKGKQVRVTMNLPKVTVIAITDWLIARGGDMSSSRPLFTSVDFQNAGHRLTGDGIYKIVKRLFKRAGVEKTMSPHRCRHSAITAVLEKTDGNVRKAQKLSRHAKLNTLQIYDDNRNRDQLEMSELLMDGLD